MAGGAGLEKDLAMSRVATGIGRLRRGRGQYQQALATGGPDVAAAARADLALLPPA